MESKIDLKRILVFIAFAFGLAWLIALIIYLTGGLANSPVVIESAHVTLAVLLLAAGYMSAPALANILTRLVTREGWSNLYIAPKFKRGWPYWILAWVVVPLLALAGIALFFVVFPQYYDASLGYVRKTLEAAAKTTGQPITIQPWTVVILQLAQAIVIAPLINGLSTLGEEFGWRAYLLQKFLPLGKRKALLWMGVIWGVWHWPITAMGHNYGFDYPGAPWLGMLMMVGFTLSLGTVEAWLTLRAGSVWPAVIAHGAVNGIGAAGALFLKGQPNPLFGPIVAGLVAFLPLALWALWIFLSPRALPEEPHNGTQVAG